jgi:hypothetical protein
MIKSINKKILGAALGMSLCFASGYLMAGQEHMSAALSHLNSAKDELQNAERDKGGHRLKAIGLINQAIAQVNMGMKAGAN